MDSESGAEAFCKAAFEGDVDTLRRLLAEGAGIDTIGWFGLTPLISAVEGGPLDAIRFLLDAGADVNATDTGGTTPLLQAIDVECDAASQMQNQAEPSTDSVELLLEYGADPRRPSRKGETPLEVARRWDAPQLVSILRDAGG